MIDTRQKYIDKHIKSYCYLVIVFFLAGFMQSVIAGSSNVRDYKAVVTAQSGLNVRSGPGTNYSKISKLRSGVTVTVTHEFGNWSKIELGPSKSAYVFNKYLRRNNSASTTPAPVNRPQSKDLNVNDYRALVTASALNVRSGPGTNYRIIGKRYRDSSVTVTHHNGIWLKITWSQRSSAYVHGDYLRRQGTSPLGPGFEGIKDPEGLQGHPSTLPATSNPNADFDGNPDPEGLVPHPTIVNQANNITEAAASMGIEIDLPMQGGDVDRNALTAQVLADTTDAEEMWFYYQALVDKPQPFQPLNQQALNEHLYWTPRQWAYEDDQLGCIGWHACVAAWEHIKNVDYESLNDEERANLVAETKEIAATYCLDNDCAEKFRSDSLWVEIQVAIADGLIPSGRVNLRRGSGATAGNGGTRPDTTSRVTGNSEPVAPRYDARIRTRAVQDPGGHDFPFSFDRSILSTKPVTLRNGAQGYALRGYRNNKPVVYNIIVRNGRITHRDLVSANKWRQRAKSFGWPQELEDIPFGSVGQ